MIRTFVALRGVAPGFHRAQVQTVRTSAQPG